MKFIPLEKFAEMHHIQADKMKKIILYSEKFVDGVHFKRLRTGKKKMRCHHFFVIENAMELIS